MYKLSLSGLLFILWIPVFLQAQDIPVGSWKEYLPYSNAIGVTQSSEKVYCINELSLYSVEKDDLSMIHYSKISGLSDIGFSVIKYDASTDLLLIGYSNSNIDLLTGGQVTNLSDIKRKNIVGDKSIYNVYFRDQYAYLACGFGIVVIDMVKKEIKDTYKMGPGGMDIKVNAITSDIGTIYAATDSGVYKADINNPNLANYANWTLFNSTNGIPVTKISSLANFQNMIYAGIKDSMMKLNGNQWEFYLRRTGFPVNDLFASSNQLLISFGISLSGSGKVLREDGSGVIDSFLSTGNIPNPLQSVFDETHNTWWVADFYRGLCRIENNIYENIYPNGPKGSDIFDMDVQENEVLIAPGKIDDWNYTSSRQGFFIRSDDNNWYGYAVDTALDFIVTAFNTVTHKKYFGSYGGGLVEIGADGAFKLFKQNSVVQVFTGDNTYRVSGLAIDKAGNLWVSSYSAAKCISVLKPDGSWKAFSPTVPVPYNQVGPMVIDQNNYKWIIIPRLNGILVYDSGEDLDDISDDRSKVLLKGAGIGNLPSNDVRSLAVDKNGEVWVGTGEGVAVFYCTGSLFSQESCDAQQILVRQDEYYGYLLATEAVTSIAIDGANRKWIGTENGVFLMSADGTKQIAHFTEDNSPLFSNFIRDISINPSNGEVYIGTEKGLIVYRSDATEAKDGECSAYVFPNPVREDYSGNISVLGLPYNCEVRITDAAGNLVYKTASNGGQANWDGNNLDGVRVSTGVYFVFSSNENGTVGCITKILVIN